MKRLSEDNNLVRSYNNIQKVNYICAFGNIFAHLVVVGAAIAVIPTSGASIPVILGATLGSYLFRKGRKLYNTFPRISYERLIGEIKGITNKDLSNVKIQDLDIVPRNIKVDEDLESLNIVPIFKEGHYIIIGSVLDGVVLRQIEEDGKEKIDLLDEEERIDILIEIATDKAWEEKKKELLKRLDRGKG